MKYDCVILDDFPESLPNLLFISGTATPGCCPARSFPGHNIRVRTTVMAEVSENRVTLSLPNMIPSCPSSLSSCRLSLSSHSRELSADSMSEFSVGLGRDRVRVQWGSVSCYSSLFPDIEVFSSQHGMGCWVFPSPGQIVIRERGPTGSFF